MNRSLALAMMPRALSFTLVLMFSAAILPAASHAQQPPGFDPAKMEEMMKQFQNPETMKKLQEQAEAAGRCMEGINEDELQKLADRAEAASKEIESLCAAGKTDEALRKGLKLSREVQNNATMKKVTECSKQLGETMKNMPWANIAGLDNLETDAPPPTRNDICR